MAVKNDSSPGFEARFMEGVALYGDKNVAREEVCAFFSQLLSDYPNSVGALMFLGSLYRNMGHFDLAIEHARRATQISPISEKSSLVFYHALHDAGLRREAFAEMERFFNQPRAQITPELYGEHAENLADSLDIPVHMIPDKRDLIREIIEELEVLQLLDSPFWFISSNDLRSTRPHRRRGESAFGHRRNFGRAVVGARGGVELDCARDYRDFVGSTNFQTGSKIWAVGR